MCSIQCHNIFLQSQYVYIYMYCVSNVYAHVFYRCQYVQKLGVPTDWQFIDVYDMTEEGLSSVSRPVLAVLLLLPLSSEVNITV